MVVEQFNYEVALKLKAYVYRLIHPVTKETFYVGKGRGNRVFQHALEARIEQASETDIMSAKLAEIRDIQKSGQQVEYVIHRHGLEDNEAFQVEAALIDAYPNLRNAVRGHYSDELGLTTVEDIQYRYNLPLCDLAPEHKLLLIKINKINGGRKKDEIYRLVRYCWRLSKQRAEAADYILAVDRGVVVGAFVAHQWLAATSNNFPDLEYADDSEAHRWGFIGEVAPSDIVEKYVGTHGKRISNLDMTPQASVRYWNC